MDEQIATPADAADRQADAEPDRTAQPVDDEQPPRLPFPVVGIGASAGGLEAVGEFLDAMPPQSGLAFVLVQHLPPDRESHMAEVLGRRTAMPVLQVEDGMAVEPDHVYVIRPGNVLTIRDGRLHLGPRLGMPRAANRPVDDFFRSLAEEQRERAICVIMSGMGSNGTAGAQAIKAVGGLCIAQDPDSAQYASMPRHLIDAGYADYILHPADLPEVLLAYASHPYASGGREADAEDYLRRERQHLREILAVLRTRTRRDFAGYKKPTFLRRVQRRMGLTRVASMAEYAKLLRQNAAEVTALADDLLIHVTGFFRDPESWEALRREVVAPLVAVREPDASIRAWVTACSSGEEAYSLAMVLVEEAERAGKPLDIKVFATDLADRALSHARAGVYPGGIESEVSPERLGRFFIQEDAVYRVRPELRDRVVFAPQNILQDPPFSRLDVASCRNLLIYLEPDVQQRVLGLLHFGLREGGALFLGSSETIGGSEDLFEAIDKKWRIFRRVGPTRHGAVEFPLPHALAAAGEGREFAPPARPTPRPRRQEETSPSLADRTRRTLLEWHTPPAVTVDRDGGILQYHGETHPFLRQPAGDPTRDVVLLAREGLRGAVRSALQQAASRNGRARVPVGWLDVEPDRRVWVAVTASPLVPDRAAGERAGPAHHFVVSFEELGEMAAPVPDVTAADDAAATEELRRLRSEYDGAIEELQSSNEELKAAHEEAMSVNEELQSANEELETSREEMQSLNEELSTVNAQLRAKMEEHQATSSDLASLLASTDIAVLFLDTKLGIRRYTPAVRDLVDLIASDVGRPLTALALRFDDPHLVDDARAVLERLAPAEREVAGADGRHYQRRVLPYRTTDNRIDGVVITFVDVTARKRAEDAVRAGEERLRRMLNIDLVGVLIFDEAGAVVEANDAFLRMTGYAREQVAARALNWRALTTPEQFAEGERQMRLLAETGRIGPYEKEYLHRDGSRSWMLFVGASLGDGTVVEYCIDVSDRRAAQEALRESEEQFRRAIEEAPIPVIMHAEDGQVLQLSRTWTELTGYALADVPTLDSWLNRAYGPGAEAVREHMHELFRAERTTLGVEFAIRTRSGADRHWSFSASAPGTLRDGRRFVVGMAVDITDRKRAEDALRESEERLRLALAAARMGIWTWDAVTGVHMRDANLNRLLGLEPIETRRPFEEFLRIVHPDDREAVSAAFRDSVEGGHPLSLEFRVVRPDGAVRWLRDQGDAFAEAAAASPHLAGACVDITDLKEAEATLREREERLRRIVEGATDYAIFTQDADRRVTSWSPGARAIFGFADAEIVGRRADLLFTPEDREGGAPEAEMRAAVRDGRAADERWHLRKDGTRFYASGVLTRLGDDGSLGLVKIASDLTGRKRMEDALREARDELERRVAERTAELGRANEALREALAARTELLRRVVTAQEEERRRISRELHDGLGQELTALILGLKSLEQTTPEDAPSRVRLMEVERIVNGIGRAAHDLAVELRPTALDDIGLSPALAAYISRWTERTGIAAEFQPLGLDGDRLPPEVESAVYRVVQEALNNVAKHADAKSVGVMVTREGGELTALVEDDGRGFDTERAGSGSGRRSLGLLGMRERVGLVGGTLVVESGEGEGTVVQARVPLVSPPEEADHGG